jgi:glycine cleavage system H protein
MSKIPEDLRYTKDHEWINLGDDGVATVGITDYAQESLGDITFVELPEIGDTFSEGDTFGVVESVKAASDLYMPVDGEVVEVNEDLEGTPEQVNQDPYGNGWIMKVKVEAAQAVEELLDPAAYKDVTGE